MSTAHSRSPRGRERALRLFAAVVAALVAAAAIPAGLAFADSSGSVTETIHTGLLSVTLSTSSVDLCSASDPLGFPNGACNSPNITITNGTAPADIEVSGSPAAPADAGNPGAGPDWTLCGVVAGGGCNGPVDPYGSGASYPGQDQYSELPFGQNYDATGVVLTNSPQCDTAFEVGPTGGCAATPGQAQTEFIGMTGPSASTDPSSTFTTTVSWTAVAQ